MNKVCPPIFFPLTLAALTGACGTLQEQNTQQLSQLDQLQAAMEQCLSNQAASQQQLQQHTEQLGQVSASLETLHTQKDSTAAAASLPTTLAATPTGPACPPANIAQTGLNKIIVGQREQIWLPGLQLALPARIDTGAETASLDARNIELFERNSQKWVRFEIVHPLTAQPIPLERKLERTALIVQANNSEAERRPVIKLAINLGPVSQSAEFTLSNRSHLDYQILVGRNILRDVMIVDVSRENLLPAVETQATGQSNAGNLP
jgi:hypothetical protein